MATCIIRSRLADGRPVLSIYLVCDQCGDQEGTPVRTARSRVFGDRLRLRIRARELSNWSRRMLFDAETGDPYDGDLCDRCKRRKWQTCV